MEGFPGVQPEDKTNVDERFQVLAAVDFPHMERKKADRYTDVPPLCRPFTGLCPVDYFGRTLFPIFCLTSKLASSMSPSADAQAMLPLLGYKAAEPK
jgi:hypothetical protein